MQQRIILFKITLEIITSGTHIGLGFLTLLRREPLFGPMVVIQLTQIGMMENQIMQEMKMSLSSMLTAESGMT